MENYKLKVISLERRQDRRKKIAHMFQHIDFEFCDGIILKIDLKFGRLNKLLKLNVVMYLFLSDEIDSMKNQIARHIEPH